MNMEAVFAKLVSISIVANWLILAVILLRVLLKKAPRRITCALNRGSSCAMLYRDADGRYGEKGAVRMINRYPLTQSSIRRMPTFWMVKPAG